MYRVVIHPEAADQIAELPPHLLLDYARALDAVAATPWDGMSHNSNNPDAEVRRWLRERAVHVLNVLWLELPED